MEKGRSHIHDLPSPLLIAPALCLAIGGWLRRWMADDGFIYLRVVQQVLAGNGPVFNAGERVEAATSPLWVMILTVVHLVTRLRLEYVAVGLGLAMTIIGMVLATVTAINLTGSGRSLAAIGPLTYGVLLRGWDYATSGLETGLSVLWLGACAYTVSVGRDTDTPLGASVLFGLGPLIRPDLAVYTLGFLTWLVISLRPSTTRFWRHLFRVTWPGLIAPATYQVFRMGYYRSLIPTTAIAKEAGMAYWSQGVVYAAEAFKDPMAVGLTLCALLAIAGNTRTPATITLGGSALVHGLFVIRAGGDFMSTRLLLPALFTFSIIAIGRSRARQAILMISVTTSLAVNLAGLVTPEPLDDGAPIPWVLDERGNYLLDAGNRHPITVEDFSTPTVTAVGAFRDEPGTLHAIVDDPDQIDDVAVAEPTVVVKQIGAVAFFLGPEWRVVDVYSITDPVGARFKLEKRQRPGHEKILLETWWPTRLQTTPHTAAEMAAAEAVGCGPLRALLDGITQPLTAKTFLGNLAHASPATFLRFESDPEEARVQLCIPTE